MNSQMTTTLARIKEHYPCTDSWRKLLKHLGKTEADDEALPYAVILESNGLDDALWACRAEPRYDREWRLYAVWCAEQVSHLMTDPRSHAALQVARRFANSEATRDQLWAAGAAAMAAARTVWDAAWAANMAAKDAALAARDAAWAANMAAKDAALAAAWAAAWAARAANRPAGDAAGDAAKNGQTAEFLRLVTGGVAQEKGDE